MTDWPNNVLQLAKAFAHAEGFGVLNAIPTRANNPGDLTGADAGSFATAGIMNADGVLKFVNLEDGWQALYIKIDRMLAGKSSVYHLTDSLISVGMKYAPGSADWPQNVADYLDVPVTTTLAELAG